MLVGNHSETPSQARLDLAQLSWANAVLYIGIGGRKYCAATHRDFQGPLMYSTAVSTTHAPAARASAPSPPACVMGISRLLPVFTLATLTALAWIVDHLLDYQFSGATTSAIAAGILLAVAAGYGWSARSPALANMAYFGALWIVFTAIGAISTYHATAMNYPLLDGAFSRMDQALGFRWADWYAFSHRYVWLYRVLQSAYNSLALQIIGSILFLCAIGMQQRCYELWWAALLSLAATSVISGLFPAAGTFEFYGVDIGRAVHLAHFHQLRDGVSRTYTLSAMQGIVTFPSYHMVMALLLTNAFRGTRLLGVIAALNAVMVLSTPVFGGHYLVDMLCGAVIAVLAAALLRALPLLTGADGAWTYDFRWRLAPGRALTLRH